MTPPEPPHVVDAWVDPGALTYRILTDKALIVGPKSPDAFSFLVNDARYIPTTAATSAGAPTDLAGDVLSTGPLAGPNQLSVAPACTALTAPDGSFVLPGNYPARPGP